MRLDRIAYRRWKGRVYAALALACLAVPLIPLASILYSALQIGGPALSPGFFVARPGNPGTSNYGGIGPAIIGSLVMIGLSSLIALPVGILLGVYMSEYGARGFGRYVSFFSDVMTGVPSIVVGVFVFSLFYLVHQNNPTFPVFTALAGGVALAVIMIPIVARTTEEALKAVPGSVREAALALGLPKYRTTMRIVFLSALPAVITGALLAVMRSGGEAAPLIITAGQNSLFGFQGFDQPVGAIPPLIYNLYQTPYANWKADAWGAALVLLIIMLVLSVVAHVVLGRVQRRLRGS